VALYVDPLVVALLAFIFLAQPGAGRVAERLALLGIALGSVFLHEVGHACMARRRGLKVSGIFLHLLPFAYVERGSPRDELRVALAGPALSLLIAALLWAVSGGAPGFSWLAPERWLHEPLWTALGINALMGVANLVPALPMDGGRALRAGLLLVMEPARAYARTARVGTFVGCALLLGALLLGHGVPRLWGGLLGVGLCIVAWREARKGQLERRQERATRRP